MNDVVGIRFRPTDEEIIMYYLARKMSGHEFPFPAVKEVDIRNYNPWELPEQSIIPDDQVWYFFSALSKKYANSNRTARTTSEGNGSWKITGKDREVKNKRTGESIGIKKTLVFYKGRNPDTIRTSWVMHEFHSKSASSYQKEYVLCRLKLKFDNKSAGLQDEASNFWPSIGGNVVEAQNVGSPVNRELRMEIDVLDSIDELEENDFFLLRRFLHPEECSSPSNGSNNESNVYTSQLDMNEEEDHFVNSLLADDVEFYEETTYSRPHALNPTKPVSRVYLGDSSDSDTETLQAQYGDADLKQYRQTQKVRASIETPLSLSLHRNMKSENGLFYDETSVSTAMPTRNNLVQSAVPTNSRACKAQAQPKSRNLVEKKCAPKILRLNDEGSTAASAVYRDRAREVKEPANNQPRKENPTVKLQKDQKMVETTKTKTISKSGSTTTDGRNRKGSLKFMETVEVNQEQIPPSIYIRNLAVGLVLSVIFIWEMVSLH